MIFVPVNRKVLVEGPRPKEEKVNGFVLPAMYTESPSEFLALRVISASEDSSLQTAVGKLVVVQRCNLDKVEYNGECFYLASDSVVAGILDA
jgi:co-chaperonin GroES (HSP10)